MHANEAGKRQGERLDARLCVAAPDEIQVVIDASTTTYLTLSRADLLEMLKHMDGERDADRREQQRIEDEQDDAILDDVDPFDMRSLDIARETEAGYDKLAGGWIG